MTEPEPHRRYREAAGRAGAEVALLAAVDLPNRLRGLLSKGGFSSAAVPASGWPAGLRETVVQTLEEARCPVVSPGHRASGFAWDRFELAGTCLGVTFCSAYLAQTGSLVFPSGPGLGTLASLLPPVHLALSLPEGLKENLAEHLSALADGLPSRLTLVTGPSRTGDIEATLTQGVHGPRRVLHWILTG